MSSQLIPKLNLEHQPLVDSSPIVATQVSPQLTTAEKVGKWTLKLIVMVGALAGGAFLSASLSLVMSPLIGVPLGSGIAFLALMKAFQEIDEYFNQRAINVGRYSVHQLPAPQNAQ